MAQPGDYIANTFKPWPQSSQQLLNVMISSKYRLCNIKGGRLLRYIDGLVQDYSISSASALYSLLQPCT